MLLLDFTLLKGKIDSMEINLKEKSLKGNFVFLWKMVRTYLKDL